MEVVGDEKLDDGKSCRVVRGETDSSLLVFEASHAWRVASAVAFLHMRIDKLYPPLYCCLCRLRQKSQLLVMVSV